MAYTVRQRWDRTLDSGLPRRDRQPCSYDAYVPDPLMPRTWAIDGDVAADLAAAETAIVRLNAEGLVLSNTEALARLLLRAESVASSAIEGLEIGGRRLLRAEAAPSTEPRARDVTAEEVLGNIRAMTWAVEYASAAERFTLDHLLEIHRLLMAGTRLAEHAGRIREVQNWIGGSAYNPCSASFVPPPPGEVRGLLIDLCDFINDDALPATAQAAIAHAQFETAHPFADGNGRTGRALIHVVLRRRGLATRVLPPVSLILATRTRAYIGGLMATRYIGDPAAGSSGVNEWLGTFAAACVQACADASAFERGTEETQQRWRDTLGRVRAGSATDLLLRALPGMPVLTVEAARVTIGRSYPAANDAIARLVEAGILKPISLSKRNRAFEAPDIIDAFTAFERMLASPASDTAIALPNRRAPARRRRG